MQERDRIDTAFQVPQNIPADAIAVLVYFRISQELGTSFTPTFGTMVIINAP